MSRHSRPKQFIPIAGDESLLAQTLKRVATPAYRAPILICNNDHRFLAAEELRQAGIQEAQILLEPCARNTAPAIVASALFAMEENPVDLLLFLPSDHLISPDDAFHETISTAVQAAQEGHFVCFGIEPMSPETGFGYIKEAKPLNGPGTVATVDRFTEKPDQETAEKFIADGHYLWNAGIFLFKASALIDEMEKLEPEIVTACSTAVSNAQQDLDFLRLDEDAFASAKSVSIDNALMERTERAAVARAKFDWSDLGSYTAIWNESNRDEAGNALVGDVTVQDASDNLLYSENQLLAAIGVNDLSVIATQDVVLVAPRRNDTDLKGLVSTLRSAKREEADTHATVYRPWGSYRTLMSGPNYLVKEIVVAPGKRLSSQYHNHRAEHWVVVEGTANIERDGKKLTLEKDQSLYIPLKAVHRLENPGDQPLHLIEVQTGNDLSEDDIIRLEDDFSRLSDD